MNDGGELTSIELIEELVRLLFFIRRRSDAGDEQIPYIQLWYIFRPSSETQNFCKKVLSRVFNISERQADL